MAANLQVIEGIASIASDEPLEPRATLKRSRPSGQRHALPLDRLRGIILAPHGLDASEVGERWQRYGTNDIIETAGRPVAELVRDTARDPMIYFAIVTRLMM